MLLTSFFASGMIFGYHCHIILNKLIFQLGSHCVQARIRLRRCPPTLGGAVDGLLQPRICFIRGTGCTRIASWHDPPIFGWGSWFFFPTLLFSDWRYLGTVWWNFEGLTSFDNRFETKLTIHSIATNWAWRSNLIRRWRKQKYFSSPSLKSLPTSIVESRNKLRLRETIFGVEQRQTRAKVQKIQIWNSYKYRTDSEVSSTLVVDDSFTFYTCCISNGRIISTPNI